MNRSRWLLILVPCISTAVACNAIVGNDSVSLWNGDGGVEGSSGQDGTTRTDGSAGGEDSTTSSGPDGDHPDDGSTSVDVASPGIDGGLSSDGSAHTDAPSGADGGAGDGSTKPDVALPPGTKLVPLTTTANGYVSPDNGTATPNTVGVIGSWFAYGDSWGTEGVGGATGVAGERGSCQLVGGFPTSACSAITSPLPAAPVSPTMPTSGDAGSGYGNGFPPTPVTSQTLCLSGTAAKVIGIDGGAPDYTNIFGIGMGLNLNYDFVNFVSRPYDAVANGVVGVQFDITATGGLPANLRVEFATEQTDDGGPHPTADSYDIMPSTAGTYQVLWTTLAKPFPPVVGTNISYVPPVDGGLAAQPMFDPTSLISIQFHVATDNMAAVLVNDLCVSNLSAIVSN